MASKNWPTALKEIKTRRLREENKRFVRVEGPEGVKAAFVWCGNWTRLWLSRDTFRVF
jgi:hypothetical protein